MRRAAKLKTLFIMSPIEGEDRHRSRLQVGQLDLHQRLASVRQESSGIVSVGGHRIFRAAMKPGANQHLIAARKSANCL